MMLRLAAAVGLRRGGSSLIGMFHVPLVHYRARLGTMDYRDLCGNVQWIAAFQE